MVPFFFLHSELETKPDQEPLQRGRGNGTDAGLKPRSRAVTDLSIFGKDESGRSIVVRIRGYRIHFYVSFRDHRLARYCFSWLLNLEPPRQLVVAVESVHGYKSMLIEKGHTTETAAGNDFTDTALNSVYRILVRSRKDVTDTIAAIDEKVLEYYSAAGGVPTQEYYEAVRFYESNLDVITSATRRLGLDACRWTRLNTAICGSVTRGSDTSGRVVGEQEYVLYVDGGEENDPTLLFSEGPASDSTAAAATPSKPTPPTPRVKVMSFDIECLSSEADTMPNAAKDPIIQISSAISCDVLCGGTTIDAAALANDCGPLSTIYPLHRRLFTTGVTCDPIPGVEVRAFLEEKDMLQSFVDHVYEEDPDIITGYNVNTFDFPYLFTRLGMKGVSALMGKLRTLATCRKRGNGETSRQYASFIPKTHDIRVPGRVIFDMYTHLRKEVSLRSYTLNSVSAHFLDGKKKEDIGYREIPYLYNGDSKSRARLGRYCVKDAQLVLEIAFETQTFVHAFERCKVFRTMLQYMIDRGQQARFYSLLLAWCSPLKLLVNDVTTSRVRATIPDTTAGRNSAGPPDSVDHDYSTEVRCDTTVIASERRRKNVTAGEGKRARASPGSDTDEGEDEDARVSKSNVDPNARDGGGKTKRAGYDGATVLDPISGIYYTPVICLDYASLYPSIMIAHNLCFTTLVKDERRGEELEEAGLAERSPIGHYFLKRAVKKGVLPSILEMLMSERAEVRKRMSTLGVTGTVEYRVLDGQQSALKIAANSIYGAIGCEKSVLNFVQIPSSVTAYGRRLIALTKDHVESTYEGTRVVYGDTDSVMVNLERWDSTEQRIWDCAAIGKEMAASTTRIIARPPIRLQFETVYRPFLLCTKKRYAAGVYSDLERLAATRSSETSPTDCRPTLKFKGLQVVRRDNCTFATRLMRFTLETLMDEKGDAVRRVTDGLRGELTNLFGGRVNTKELVISKEWKRRCANAQAHDRLARRMQERDPNSAPNIGDRVPYIVITVPRGARLCDRAEDPLYATENGLCPDYMYYADNQVARPIAELLRVVLRNVHSLEDVKDAFWPTDAPKRVTDRRGRVRGTGEKRWTKKAAVGNRRLEEFFRLEDTGRDSTDSTTRESVIESQNGLLDVEDVLDGLAAKCMACKNEDAEAIRSCRDRECETLYDRFAKLDLRRRLSRRLESSVPTGEIGGGGDADNRVSNESPVPSSGSPSPVSRGRLFEWVFRPRD